MSKNESDSSCQYTHFDARKPSSSALEEILKEIGETEESRIHGLKEVRKKLKELEGIEACLDEDFLLRFLRVESFDSARALERLKNFYDMQEEMLEMFKHCSIDATVVERVPDFSKMTFDEKSYLDLIAINSLLMNPLTQMSGISLIFDWSGFHMSSFLAFKPVSVIRLMNHMLKSLPVRIKEIHVVNIHAIFRVVCNFFYFVLPKELRSCVFFHPNDDWKSLHQFIPPEILPEEYGGHLKQSSMINLLEDVKKLEMQFGELFTFGYVKTKNIRQSLKLIK
ncbi:alpha-tocopherol transfer protein-like isoform X2 [Argiope bruennichi]|uniref:alpha-tocopherol transfer protein-like isoform X2 n=1 Tax=Argiope bruennichi TaxID=94029 RepID=UPI0024945A4C|nr:alpha-tocopherol transfer protein-like isoform X2 [Argiope bruennichi]